MRARRAPFSLLGFLLAFAALHPVARAQSAALQTLTNATGYLLQVPSTWQIAAAADPSGTIAESTDGSEAVFVIVVPSLGGADQLPSDVGGLVLQSLTQEALSAAEGETAYTVTSPAVTTSVPGADEGETGTATYTDQNGSQVDQFVLTAVRGSAGFLVLVRVPAGAGAAAESQAEAVLRSFQLTAPPSS